MNPIFEQQSGEGIGYGYEYFLKRFIDICESHLKNGRAKSFAFILYDFHDKQIREILKTQGGFAELDRLSGSELSIFYINSEDKHLINSFNKIFLGAFKIKKKAELPFVLFFKVEDKDVIDVKIVELVRDNILFSFQELYTTIASYLKNSKELPKPKLNKIISFISNLKKTTVDELIRIIISKGIEQFE